MSYVLLLLAIVVMILALTGYLTLMILALCLSLACGIVAFGHLYPAGRKLP